MTNQPYSWPIQVYIRDYINQYTTISGQGTDTETIGNWSTLYPDYSAVSVVYSMVVCAVIPILAIYPFIQKYFAKGVNMGGVKE